MEPRFTDPKKLIEMSSKAEFGELNPAEHEIVAQFLMGDALPPRADTIDDIWAAVERCGYTLPRRSEQQLLRRLVAEQRAGVNQPVTAPMPKIRPGMSDAEKLAAGKAILAHMPPRRKNLWE